MNKRFFEILQICDSAFPTGGFSHSLGCEAAFQKHYIKSKEDLKTFTLGCLENTGSFSLPYVKAAHQTCTEFEKLCALDSLHHAALVNHVTKRASLQQGHSFLNTSSEAFSLPIFKKYQDLVENEKMHGHQVTLFGAVCASLKIQAEETIEMYLYNTLRTITASAVRLGKIGTLQAQNFQFEMQNCLGPIIDRNCDKLPEDAMVMFPLLGVIQNSHDALFLKLFYS